VVAATRATSAAIAQTAGRVARAELLIVAVSGSRGTDIDVEGGTWLHCQRRVGDYRAFAAQRRSKEAPPFPPGAPIAMTCRLVTPDGTAKVSSVPAPLYVHVLVAPAAE
jgi:hypothetical protein